MLKIVLSGRGLALTVQLFGRVAGRCGLCAETLALLALGILACIRCAASRVASCLCPRLRSGADCAFLSA